MEKRGSGQIGGMSKRHFDFLKFLRIKLIKDGHTATQHRHRRLRPCAPTGLEGFSKPF